MNAIIVEGFPKHIPTVSAGRKLRSRALVRGASGAVFGFGAERRGKSTTIKILLNLIVPTTGHATILDRPVTDKAIRSRVGYLPENPNFYDYLTPDELLWFGGTTSGMMPARIRERTDRLLRLVDLDHVRRKRLRTFSKGMLQRAGVGLALINDPDVVVFDERVGLDPLGQRWRTSFAG
jgi:ABC-2 type transport system ATP-binding protein